MRVVYCFEEAGGHGATSNWVGLPKSSALRAATLARTATIAMRELREGERRREMI